MFNRLNKIVSLKKFNRYIFLYFNENEKNLRVIKMMIILKMINPRDGKENRSHFCKTLKFFAESRSIEFASSKTNTEKKEMIVE